MPCAASSALAADRVLALHLQHDAGIHEEAMALAAEEATRIFEAAGVNTTWVGPRDPDNADDSAVHVTVVVVDSGKSARLMSELNVGDSLLGAAIVPSRRAYVFYDQILRQTAGTSAQCLLFGKVIAHEVGHLLVEPGHSPNGIMRARVSQQWVDLFTPEQATVMRALLAQPPGTRGENAGARRLE